VLGGKSCPRTQRSGKTSGKKEGGRTSYRKEELFRGCKGKSRDSPKKRPPTAIMIKPWLGRRRKKNQKRVRGSRLSRRKKKGGRKNPKTRVKQAPVSGNTSLKRSDNLHEGQVSSWKESLRPGGNGAADTPRKSYRDWRTGDIIMSRNVGESASTRERNSRRGIHFKPAGRSPRGERRGESWFRRGACAFKPVGGIPKKTPKKSRLRKIVIQRLPHLPGKRKADQ